MLDVRGEKPIGQVSRPWWLIALAIPAAAALLARRPDGSSFLNPAAESLIQLPLILAWLRRRVVSASPPRGERLAVGATLVLAAVVAFWAGRPLAWITALTCLILGLGGLAGVCAAFRELSTLVAQPTALAQRLFRRWAALLLLATLLLSLPLSTRAGVPDYRHNFWHHVLNCGFAATGACTLTGAGPFSFGEDYSRFGQWVLIVSSQVSALGFMLVGLSTIGPFLGKTPRPATVLKVYLGSYALGAALLYGRWSAGDAADPIERCWWSLVHAGSALAGSGYVLRFDGLATYLADRVMFAVVTALCIAGSIGLPVLVSLISKEAPETRRAAGPRFARREVLLTLGLLVAGAVGLFVLETPRFLPEGVAPSRPFELGGLVSLRDEMPPGQRWHLAVFVSSTLRSAGMQSYSAAEGALSWPAIALLWTFMLIGGSAGGCSGGLRLSTITLWSMRATDSVRRPALARMAVIWLAAAGAFCGLMVLVQPASTYDRLFETVAAYANVSLTTNLSAHLTWAGRLVMIGAMIAGRWIATMCWADLALRALRLRAEAARARPIER
jgi:trk system potassium uptake protein TrkH